MAKHLQEVSLAALPQMVGRDNDADSDSSRSANEHGKPSTVDATGDAVSESGQSSATSSWGSSDNDVEEEAEEAEEEERNQVTKDQPQKPAEGSHGHNPSTSGSIFIFRAGNDGVGGPTTNSNTGGFEDNLPFQFHSQNQETTFPGPFTSHLEEKRFRDIWPPTFTQSLQQAHENVTADDFPRSVANLTINTNDDKQGSLQEAE